MSIFTPIKPVIFARRNILFFTIFLLLPLIFNGDNPLEASNGKRPVRSRAMVAGALMGATIGAVAGGMLCPPLGIVAGYITGAVVGNFLGGLLGNASERLESLPDNSGRGQTWSGGDAVGQDIFSDAGLGPDEIPINYDPGSAKTQGKVQKPAPKKRPQTRTPTKSRRSPKQPRRVKKIPKTTAKGKKSGNIQVAKLPKPKKTTVKVPPKPEKTIDLSRQLNGNIWQIKSAASLEVKNLSDAQIKSRIQSMYSTSFGRQDRDFSRQELVEVYAAFRAMPAGFVQARTLSRANYHSRSGAIAGITKSTTITSSRGVYGYSDIVMYNPAAGDFSKVLVHEFMHASSFRTGLINKWQANFSKKNSPTTYGKSDIEEDMCESVGLYYSNPVQLKACSKERYNFIKKYIMQNKEFI
ncbi:hypothetical protein ACFL35_10210 [Candidatus Riflebacteria bacterium]